ncbi:hypothetical protein ABZY45_19785 [Streptomyces sp. NPDC006516]|uniref:hypothetical protein n=1 Tax=Streptomyces sp. NPDC006516 TaxID=3154309 RepID=UPI0033A5760E
MLEESVLDVLRVLVLVVGAARGVGLCGVEEVGEGGHMEGERVPVSALSEPPGWLQVRGSRAPVAAGQAGDGREREREGEGGIAVVAGAPVGLVLQRGETAGAGAP